MKYCQWPPVGEIIQPYCQSGQSVWATAVRLSQNYRLQATQSVSARLIITLTTDFSLRLPPVLAVEETLLHLLHLLPDSLPGPGRGESLTV